MVKDLLEGANIYSDVLVYIVDKDRDFREKLILELKCQGLDACGFDSASSFFSGICDTACLHCNYR